MMQERDWSAMVRRVAEADTDDFAHLVKITGLDPASALRFGDFSNVSFRRADLRGFDFSGAKLHGCDFWGARIQGARFDAAEIGAAQISSPPEYEQRKSSQSGIANLRGAVDWTAHVRSWLPPERPLSDRHLRPGAIFQDAPFAPEMVVVPAGTFTSVMAGEEPTRRYLLDASALQLEPEPQLNSSKETTISRPFAVGRFAVTLEEWNAAQAHPDWKRYALVQTPTFHLHSAQVALESFSMGRLREPFEALHAAAFEAPRKGKSLRSASTSKMRRRNRFRRPFFNWYQASAYIRWLAAVTDRPYQLLSVVEWNYCAQAGASFDGDIDGQLQVALGGSSDRSVQELLPFSRGGHGYTQNFAGPSDDGEGHPNAWGLHDIKGFVWEWCRNQNQPDFGCICGASLPQYAVSFPASDHLYYQQVAFRVARQLTY
jgi:formylglycine-generating enzyme required for sulfatase activity